MKKRASIKSAKSKQRAKTTRDLPVAKKSTSVRAAWLRSHVDSYAVEQLSGWRLSPGGPGQAAGLTQGWASNHTGLRLSGLPL